jgi:hypothetical protein
MLRDWTLMTLLSNKGRGHWRRVIFQNIEPRVFFGERIFERKIFEKKYSKALFCKLFSIAMILRKMFDAKEVRY